MPINVGMPLRLLHRADEAMHNVKRQSKGGIAFAEFDPAAD